MCDVWLKNTRISLVNIYGFPLDGKYKATLGTARTDATAKKAFICLMRNLKTILTKILHEALNIQEGNFL